MTITLTSRKEPREKIAELLGEITTLVAVYDHQVKDFGRRSPVAMVWSDGTTTLTQGYTHDWHRFWVAVLWDREDGDATEDYIDDLSQAVRQKLFDNPEVAGVWDDLALLEEFSLLSYPVLDGRQYRMEQFQVLVKSICTVS